MSYLASQLQSTVNLMVMEIEKREELEKRVDSVETKVNSIKSLRDLSQFRSVPARVHEMELENLDVEEIWLWCEKFAVKRNVKRFHVLQGVKSTLSIQLQLSMRRYPFIRKLQQRALAIDKKKPALSGLL